MVTAAEIAWVRAALAERAADVAMALLGAPNLGVSNRRELRFGRKGSLAVVIAGAKAGLRHDHERDQGGDLLDLIMRERGGNFREALQFAADFVGGQVVAPSHRTSRRDRGPPRAANEAPQAEQNKERAMAIWREAQPIAGTIAARYLASRRVADVICDDRVLRFHPSCPYGATRHRCLIALMRDVITNEAKAIQRTALTPAGEKIGRLTLGPKTGAAIKLTADECVQYGLAVGEGLETTLAAMHLGFAPAWALGDAVELARFPVLAGIEALACLVDNDGSGTGPRAAIECSQRWTAAGREVRCVIPRRIGADLNDVITQDRRDV